MPIYAYKCSACGFAKDVLRKMSDAPLTECPNCGASAFEKQVTAAGFQLKGSGWYVTDFRDGGGKKAAESKGEGAPAADDAKPAAAAEGAAAPAPAASSAPAAAPAPAAPAPAASPTPAAKTD
ncbi:MAG: zinc ribbon domain-containing protein [Variovorax sp.]|nr:MAG: zinc ribbon domain-containing protein [Variovorax sp.]